LGEGQQSNNTTTILQSGMSSPHHLPAVIYGFFSGKEKFGKISTILFYDETVPEKPLRKHRDQLPRNTSVSSVATMGMSSYHNNTWMVCERKLHATS
jgi:hypothetical protein